MKKNMKPVELLALIMGDKENAKRAALPLGIEAQEMDGQQMLLTSKLVPKDMRPDRGTYEKLGFVFGPAAEGIFLEATYPEGWSVVATEHSLHSRIVDEQARERCSLFYRAAFYDRHADCTLLCRYIIKSQDVGSDYSQYELVVWDNGTQQRLKSFGAADSSNPESLEPLRSAASAWLNEQYPESKNPLAYW